jgi:hypothetical protein
VRDPKGSYAQVLTMLGLPRDVVDGA